MDLKLIEDFARKEKANKLKHKKKQQESSEFKSKKPKLEEVESSQSASYRDRADERRKGINKDFEHDPEDLKVLLGSSTYDDDIESDEESRRMREIEDSKYLGGDVEHTHLVKGLDFALLQKVKDKQKQEEKLAGERPPENAIILGDIASDSEEEEFRMEAILAATDLTADQKHKIDLNKLRRGQMTDSALLDCQNPLAKRIMTVLQEKFTSKSDLFLPGRMTYIVPLDEDCDETTVITQLRSKAEVPDIKEMDDDDEKDIQMDYIISKLARIRKGEIVADDGSEKIKKFKKKYENSIDYY